LEGGISAYDFLIEDIEESDAVSAPDSDHGFQRNCSVDEQSLQEAKQLAREKFEWLTRRAVVAQSHGGAAPVRGLKGLMSPSHSDHVQCREAFAVPVPFKSAGLVTPQRPERAYENAAGAALNGLATPKTPWLADPTPHADRKMAQPGSYRSAAQYLSACERYALKPNGGALLGLSLGLQMLEVDGTLSNLELVPLCAALLDAPFIQHLRLSGQPLQDTGAAVLALALPGCPWISELELVNCKITGTGIRLLCGAVPKSGIHRLVLRNNILRQHAHLANVALAEVVEHARFLTSLDLQSCSLSAEGMRLIKQAMIARGHRGHSPCSVHFEGNFVLVEVLNSVTHGACALVCVEAWRRMHGLIVRLCNFESRMSVTLFVASMLAMFSGSTLYHSMFAVTDLTWFFRLIDHCAIYFLIAGTYTPVFVMGCRHPETMEIRDGVFAIVGAYWGVVAFGIIIEHMVAQRTPPWYGKFVLLMYVLLGFGGVPYIAGCPLVQSADVMMWIELGGLTYIIGIVFFLLDKRYPAMHVIWHMLVGLAAFFHFVAVWDLAHEVLSDPRRSCERKGLWSSAFSDLIMGISEDPTNGTEASQRRLLSEHL